MKYITAAQAECWLFLIHVHSLLHASFAKLSHRRSKSNAERPSVKIISKTGLRLTFHATSVFANKKSIVVGR